MSSTTPTSVLDRFAQFLGCAFVICVALAAIGDMPGFVAEANNYFADTRAQLHIDVLLQSAHDAAFQLMNDGHEGLNEAVGGLLQQA